MANQVNLLLLGLPMDFLVFLTCKSRENGKSMEIRYSRKNINLEFQKYTGGMNLVRTTNHVGLTTRVCGLTTFPGG